MIIKADKTGIEAIQQIADIAIKAYGLQISQSIHNMLGKIELIEEKPVLKEVE